MVFKKGTIDKKLRTTTIKTRAQNIVHADPFSFQEQMVRLRFQMPNYQFLSCPYLLLTRTGDKPLKTYAWEAMRVT